MKALSLATLLGLSITGVACSQAADAPSDDVKPAPAQTETSETAPPAATEKPATEVSGSFNLGLPTAPADSANSGFNLGLPSETGAPAGAFNLGTDVSASNGLAALPEIEAPLTETTDKEKDPLADIKIDDEPVIRID